MLLLCWYGGSQRMMLIASCMRTKWFFYHYDMEWDGQGVWVSDCGFISTCLNQQSAQPLCCAMNKALALGFHEVHWMDSWFGPDTLPLSLITVCEWHFPFDPSAQLFLHLFLLTYFSLTQDISVIPCRKTERGTAELQTMSVYRSQNSGSPICYYRVGFTGKNHYFQGQFFKGNIEICYEIKANRCWILF